MSSSSGPSSPDRRRKDLRGTTVPLPLRVLEPPYRRLPPPVADDEALGMSLPDAPILLVDAGDPLENLRELRRWISLLRLRQPGASVVLRVHDRTPSEEVVSAAFQAGQLGIDGVVAGEEWDPRSLRRQLTRPARLEASVIHWLERRRNAPLPGKVRSPLRALLAGEEGEASGRSKASKSGVSRAIRRRFRNAPLAPPFRFGQLGTSLRAALRIQREPDTSIEEVAYGTGIKATSTLYRRMDTLFGLTPGGLRGTLGWQWLLERWWRRIGER